MAKNLKYFLFISLIISFIFLLKLKLENNTLRNKLDETDSKYRELRTKKIADA